MPRQPGCVALRAAEAAALGCVDLLADARELLPAWSLLTVDESCPESAGAAAAAPAPLSIAALNPAATTPASAQRRRTTRLSVAISTPSAAHPARDELYNPSICCHGTRRLTGDL